VTPVVPHQPTIFGGPSHRCPSTCQRQRQPRPSRTSITVPIDFLFLGFRHYFCCLSEHRAAAAPAALDGRRQGGGARVSGEVKRGKAGRLPCSVSMAQSEPESRLRNWHGSRSPAVQQSRPCPAPRHLHHSATAPVALLEARCTDTVTIGPKRDVGIGIGPVNGLAADTVCPGRQMQ
jgi:hypothetical protein